MGAA
ncbi:hypothetical protein LINGRAHAP2_LOCUS3038 [Linum grandiflorum]|jgi:hypothetical protein